VYYPPDLEPPSPARSRFAQPLPLNTMADGVT
jgi:hypothetical protein